MTFSICVREPYEVTEDGATTDRAADESEAEAGSSETETHHRFGVAVTTRLPAVGALCPFANAHGAVATQSRVNVDLGRRGVAYLADGLGIADALEALLEVDDGAPERQLHGVDRSAEFAFSGEECNPWYGDEVRDGYTVAGNLLTGEAVVSATADAYESRRVTGDADGSAGRESDHDPLAARLVEALAAGQAQGGDKREDLPIQSAAVLVATSEGEPVEERPLYSDLRVDATETPIVDLRETVTDAVEVQATLEERAQAENRSGSAAEADGE